MAELNRRYVFTSNKMQLRSDGPKLLAVNNAGVDQDGIPVVDPRAAKLRPWRLSTDVPRAALDTIIAGVGYLLWVASL